MKRFFKIAITAMLSFSLLAGCAGNKADETSKGAEQTPASTQNTDNNSGIKEISEEDKYGGVINISLSAIPKTIDPVQYTGMYESDVIVQIADTIVGYNNNLSEIVPQLATEWTVSEDGLVYTFKLRDDVYFQPSPYQDGRKMTAEDVKYSLERSAKESALKRLEPLERCEVVSEYEVNCYLNTPDATFLTLLTNSGNVIVSKEDVEGFGDDFSTNLIGTGPFKLEEFVRDTSASLVRFDKYWGPKPYLDGINFRFITDPNQTINALRTGEIQIATGVTGEGVDLIQQDPNLSLVKAPKLHVAYIYMNMMEGPTKDIKVREAIYKAIDIEQLVKGVYQNGEAERAYLPLPMESWGYDASQQSIIPAYDPEGAKALLAEAGFPDGFSTEIYISDTPARVKMATIMQQMLKQNLNVDAAIKTSEWGAFSEVASSGKAPIYGMSWTWYPDPYFYLNKMFHSNAIGDLGNGAGYNNPEVDKLLDEALLVTDQSERAKLYKEATKLITTDLPAIWWASEYLVYGVNNKVKDFPTRADDYKTFVGPQHNTYLEK